MGWEKKKHYGYEKSVPRCANCEAFLDGGKARKDRETKRRYHCVKFGWAITRISICDEWICARTGETFILEDDQ